MWFLPLALLTLPFVQTPTQSESARPNVVLIYGDDVGWGDLGAYGSELIPTPNLDRLCAQGLRFTDAHCSAATCTPSRFALLTGVHGFRSGVRVLAPDAPLTIDPDAFTLADLFQRAGYATAVVGKWHLGLGSVGERVDWNADVGPGPLDLGFEYSFLLPSTNDRVPCVYLDGRRVLGLDPSDPLFVGTKPDGVECTVYPDGRATPEAMTYYRKSHGHDNSVINGIGRIGTQFGGSHALWDDETMADEFVARASRWVRARERDQPFFLYFSSQDIHVPRTPHPRFRGRTVLGHRGDAMVALDWAVGELLTVLEREGVAQDTLVIFTSDNGPVYDDGYMDGTVVRTSTAEVDQGHDGSGPWRGGKYQIYEGGTRVPFVVRWPGRVEPGVSDALVTQTDLLASFAALFDVPLPEGQARDSRDQLPALLGDDPLGAPFIVEEAGRLALRRGPWKYVAPRAGVASGYDGAELYDLATDPRETVNLIARRPVMAGELRALLARIVASEGGLRALDD
jgi:arylsulfatase A